MPYCPKCGAEIDDEWKFCRTCGTTLQPTKQESFSVSSDDLVTKVKELLHEGNVRRIIIKDESGRNLIEIPVTVGLIGVLLAPWLAALGTIAALATRCTIVVERRT
jgi:uncharacterized membrane protein YvbJ